MTEARFRPYAPGSQPPNDAPAYRSTGQRHPAQQLVGLPEGQTLTEMTAPQLTSARYPAMADLSRTGAHLAQGERIIVAGRVTDEDGRAVPHVMIEIWQANAAGRYGHPGDQHAAPLDPHFHAAKAQQTGGATYVRHALQ